MSRLEVKPLFIEPGSPRENGYIESFNGKFRDEFLNRELLDTLLEAQVLTTRWRQESPSAQHFELVVQSIIPYPNLTWRRPS